MSDEPEDQEGGLERRRPTDRPVRADARRNTDALLEAALAVFATSGVDAPVREIAVRAGVGVGTVYRHFPLRADLVAAVFRREVDALRGRRAGAGGGACAGRGIGALDAALCGLHRDQARPSDRPAFGRPDLRQPAAYFNGRLRPALRTLLDAAAASGEVRADIEPDELLSAVAGLCMRAPGEKPDHARRMVALLVDGLRYGAGHR
ncbi:MAG: helix-turn-helix domain-containing protein [Rhizomicrobium sp.]